jgi:ABC-type sugar transport system substrate-binding protein
VPVGPSNPNGVYASMNADLKKIYSSYPNELIQSPWATAKIKAKPPWKIGFIAFAITNPYNQDVLDGLKQQFAAAKAKGLVTGDLITNIPATMAASTAEQQISAIQQMVAQGVNAIILLPVDSVAEAPAINAAGKAGVPVILADTPPAPNTEYAVSAWSQNQVEADAGALGLIKSGNIVMVKGIAGNENDVVLYNQAIADLKNCPDIHVAATLYGNWDQGTAKTVVSQYIASHPQPLAGVIQDGGMMSGIIQAFESTGAKVPVIADGECGGGDLSWWRGRLLQRLPGRLHLHGRHPAGARQQGPQVQRALDADDRHHQRQPGRVRQARPAAVVDRRGRRPGDRLVRRRLPGQVLHRHRRGHRKLAADESTPRDYPERIRGPALIQNLGPEGGATFMRPWWR